MTTDATLRRAIGKTVGSLLEAGAHTATTYLSSTLTVRATRVLYGRKILRAPSRYDISLTVGRPNFAARAFIKNAKAAGEPFPIKKVHLKFVTVAKR